VLQYETRQYIMKTGLTRWQAGSVRWRVFVHYKLQVHSEGKGCFKFLYSIDSAGRCCVRWALMKKGHCRCNL
jgi:hypothetical protein